MNNSSVQFWPSRTLWSNLLKRHSKDASSIEAAFQMPVAYAVIFPRVGRAGTLTTTPRLYYIQKGDGKMKPLVSMPSTSVHVALAL